MNRESFSVEDVEACQTAILDFMPVPVTERQRQALEKYRAGNQEAVQADIKVCGDYGKCLLSLLKAKEDLSSATEQLNEAAQFAIRYAGVADGSELYATLSEVLPTGFTEKGLL